jgi:hypothetical protein
MISEHFANSTIQILMVPLRNLFVFVFDSNLFLSFHFFIFSTTCRHLTSYVSKIIKRFRDDLVCSEG